MSRGCSNREIADALAITDGTVKNYVSNILPKMGVRDRTRAVLKALESGVLCDHGADTKRGAVIDAAEGTGLRKGGGHWWSSWALRSRSPLRP